MEFQYRTATMRIENWSMDSVHVHLSLYHTRVVSTLLWYTMVHLCILCILYTYIYFTYFSYWTDRQTEQINTYIHEASHTYMYYMTYMYHILHVWYMAYIYYMYIHLFRYTYICHVVHVVQRLHTSRQIVVLHLPTYYISVEINLVILFWNTCMYILLLYTVHYIHSTCTAVLGTCMILYTCIEQTFTYPTVCLLVRSCCLTQRYQSKSLNEISLNQCD